jgi:hypothetical protein
MSEVLTDGDQIQCGHRGTVAVSSTTKLTVSVGGIAHRVLVGDDVVGKPIPDCTTTVTPAGTRPCGSVVALTAGQAVKLTLGGKAAVLATVKGTTLGNPPANFAVVPVQRKLTAV